MWLASLIAAALSFEQIVASADVRHRDLSCSQMQEWVDAHPADPQAPRGLIWMAQLWRADQRDERARPLFERVVRDYGASEWAQYAQQGLADLDLREHRYESAIARYHALAQVPAPLWNYVGRNGEENARGEQRRFRWLLFVVIGTLALCLARLARAGLRSLWPPPRELIYALPILLVTLAAAGAQEPGEARAVATVALGGMALLWLNGAWLRQRRGRAGLAALLGVAQAAGLVYCAIAWNGLWAKLIDTLTMGAE